MKWLLILFVFLFTMLLTYNAVAQEIGPGDSGTLLTNGVLVTTFSMSVYGDLRVVVFDGTYYYVFEGMGSTYSSSVYQLDVNFNVLTAQPLLFDCRGAFYNPADGEVYMKVGTDLLRVHTNPFDGGYDTVLTNIFQDGCSKVCNSLDGTKMYDHLNGIVREYDFTTGTILDTITLDLQTVGNGCLIAHSGTYLLTFADSVVYAYDVNDGSFVSACTVTTHNPQFSWYEWSMCYTNGMFFITDVPYPMSPRTYYVWTIDQGVPVELTSFSASANGKEVILNWSTATELNNQGFEIQRSIEAREFFTVGFVNGHGTTTEQQNYSFADRSLDDGNYYYRLKQIDYDGSYEYSNVIEVDYRTFNSYLLEQNYPNPFNPTTTIGFGIQNKSNVKITILNSIGEEVAVVLNEEREPGFHQVEFNAASLPSGVYLYQLKAGEFISTKKMILLK